MLIRSDLIILSIVARAWSNYESDVGSWKSITTLGPFLLKIEWGLILWPLWGHTMLLCMWLTILLHTIWSMGTHTKMSFKAHMNVKMDLPYTTKLFIMESALWKRSQEHMKLQSCFSLKKKILKLLVKWVFQLNKHYRYAELEVGHKRHTCLTQCVSVPLDLLKPLLIET